MDLHKINERNQFRTKARSQGVHFSYEWRRFFRSCHFSQERITDASQVIGNDTLEGQIVSFMENLHLSYKEVFEEIPYARLLVMQKDKLRVVTGQVVRKGSAKEISKRRRQN